MLRQSTRERARILGGMGRADRRGLTMTGVIDVGVEGGFHGGITLGGALAELQQHRHFLSLSLSGGVHSMAGRPHAALIMQFRALARSLN